MLARAGEGHRVPLLRTDEDTPYDRIFSSKHYLTGEKSRADCMMPIPGLRVGVAQTIHADVNVTSIDIEKHALTTAGGERIGCDPLVLTTGAEPIMPSFEGSDLKAVHPLRTLADADALIQSAASAKTVAVVGAIFIGLEVAASMVAKDLKVAVIARDEIPLAAVLGDEIGRFVASSIRRRLWTPG